MGQGKNGWTSGVCLYDVTRRLCVLEVAQAIASIFYGFLNCLNGIYALAWGLVVLES